jgi:hypothetical protein
MVRVPDTPPKPVAPILTVQDHIYAGYQVIVHCSAFPAQHKHIPDLQASIAAGDTMLDHHWTRAQRCRECGAPGGGVTVAIYPG